MGGKTALSAFLLKKFGEHVTSVLTATVWTEDLNLCAMLCVGPRDKYFIGFEGLVLGAKNIDISVVGVIIGKSDVIVLASETGGWWCPPEVGMDFCTKVFSWGCDMFRFDGFVS